MAFPAVEIPRDWNPAKAVWSGASSLPTMLAAIQALTDDLANLNGRHAGSQAALDALVTAYNAHILTAGVHVDSDLENTLVAPVATDLTADVLVLVNDAAAMYIAHVAQGVAIHPGGLDAVNALTATNPATNEAEAALLMTDIKTMYELHRANGGGAYHTNPDATNTITEPNATDWDTCVVLANGFKNTTGFNAHVILTAGPVHGATGVADIITAPNSGTQIAAVYVELNQVKTFYNRHTASEGWHDQAGTAEATADATTEATTVALANALKATLDAHFPDAGVHLGADLVSDVTAADITEYEDALPLVADLRAQFDLHIPVASVHTGGDAVNTGTPLGVGGAVTILLTSE